MERTLSISDDAGRNCEIRIGRNIAGAGQLLLPGAERAAVLTQPAVSRLGAEIADEIKTLGVLSAVKVLPDRDAGKNLRTVESVYQWLNNLGFTRGDMLVAVGGGAATDLVGFVAATYLRGIEVSYLPTTLLGAVDAAIGGKTGVNVDGKNLAGVFRHPARVIVDLAILDRLPKSLLREGAAETVKAGFIADPSIVTEYEKNGISAALDRVVAPAIQVKVDTVTADFRESGRRAILNYGHTIGHAVEIAAGISHGDAVAIGMVAAGHVSARLAGFVYEERQRTIIAGIGLPVTSPRVAIEQVMTLLGRDKKRDRGGIRMVLLEDFGSPIVRHVTDEDIAAGLAAVGIAAS